MIGIARLKDGDRMDLFRNTANKMGLNDAIVEKDFWVCYTLDFLFHRTPWFDHFSFKGGTSLSKAYHLISRFSEDIDLIMDWRLIGYGKDEPWKVRSKSKQEAYNLEMNARTEAFLADVFCHEAQKAMSTELGRDVDLRIDPLDPMTVLFAYPYVAFRYGDGTDDTSGNRRLGRMDTRISSEGVAICCGALSKAVWHCGDKYSYSRT